MMHVDSNSVLSDYEYVQQCLNLDHDIRFVVVDVDSVQKPFQRTARLITSVHTQALQNIAVEQKTEKLWL